VESFGDRTVAITGARVAGKVSGTGAVQTGEDISIEVTVVAHRDVPEVTVGIEISDASGDIVFGTNTHLLGATAAVTRGSRRRVTFHFVANLNLGRYFVTVAATQTQRDRTVHCFDWQDHLVIFDIVGYGGAYFVGHSLLTTSVDWT
jgi:lipopolysaccharide transport system ATP-binding protein